MKEAIDAIVTAFGILLMLLGAATFAVTFIEKSDTILQQLYHQQAGHTGLLVVLIGACLVRR